MAYKDKSKQKQASKEAMRRLRAKNKGEAISGQKQGLENAPGLTRMAKVKVEGVNLPVNPSVVNPCVNPKGSTNEGVTLSLEPQNDVTPSRTVTDLAANYGQ